MPNLPWFFTRPLELTAAFTVVFLLTSYLDQREQDRFNSTAETEWFEVTELFVPDHEVGGNPLLAYDREIRKPFRGYWVAEIKSRDSHNSEGRFFTACTGNGQSDYGADDMLDPAKVTWEWFLGRPCDVPPGIYRMEVTWDMKVPEFDRVKRYTVLSNPFTVYAQKGPPRR